MKITRYNKSVVNVLDATLYGIGQWDKYSSMYELRRTRFKH